MLIPPPNKKIDIKILLIVLFATSFILNIFQFGCSVNYIKKIKEREKAWEEAEKLIEKEKRTNDSAYFSVLDEIKRKNSEIDSIRIADKKRFDLQISKLKSRYGKEYVDVSNNDVDGTLNVSTKYLSEEIDYSKFQGSK